MVDRRPVLVILPRRDDTVGGCVWLRSAITRRNEPESQQVITDAYTGIGRELGATVVPVGLAWQRFLGKHDQPVLHDRDQSHPTLAGSYLAACVFLAVLFGESPVGLGGEVAGLSEKDLALLEKVARQTCNSTARRA